MKLSIPSPCNEDWHSMAPVAKQKRHCASCDRVLTDFTNMTDLEIGNYLRRNPGKICGRFSTHQLDRQLALGGPQRFNGFRAVAAASALLLTMPVVGQGKIAERTEWTEREKKGELFSAVNLTTEVVPTKVLVSGVVTNAIGDNNALSFATIMLFVDGLFYLGTNTDADGHFSLEAPTDGKITLEVRYTGFEDYEVVLDKTSLLQGDIIKVVLQTAKLPLSDALMGFVVPRPSLTDRILGSPHTSAEIRSLPKREWPIYKPRLSREKHRNPWKNRAVLMRNDRQQITVDTKVLPTAQPPAPLHFTASPNPFTDHLKVAFDLDHRGAYGLELYSATGQRINRWEGKLASGPHEVLLEQNIGALPAGMYFLELKTATAASVITVVR